MREDDLEPKATDRRRDATPVYARMTESFMLAGAGVRLSGQTWRRAAPGLRTVVLLHGGGQTRHSWASTATQLLAAGFDVVAYDLRGHGDSDWDPQGRYGLEDHVADAQVVLASLPGPCVLVGGSLGGLTALTAAAADKRKVVAVVLVDVTPTIETAGTQRIRAFMEAEPEGYESLEHAAAAVRAYQADRSQPVTAEGLRKNLRQAAGGRWRWHWDPQILDLDDAAYERTRKMSKDSAQRLGIPLLLVRGMRSDVVADTGVAELAALAAQLRVLEVAGAGHLVAGDDNGIFTQALVPFLREAFDLDSSARS